MEDRPRFMRALLDLREHGAGLLVVAKRDRLARDVEVCIVAERLVAEFGARVVTADGLSAEATPEGQLMRTILDAFAQYERAMIRARTKAAMLAKGRRGEYTGGEAPYGYRASGANVVEDEDEQRVIRLIRSLHGNGHGPSVIARDLNSSFMPCRGSVWHAKSVARVLSRERESA